MIHSQGVSYPLLCHWLKCRRKRGFSKGLLIGEIGNRDDTIGVFVNPLREGEGFIEELIPTVKEFNFF